MLGYRDRPAGPHPDAELLCPTCGTLAALGWLADALAVAHLGASLRCSVCGGTFATVEARENRWRPAPTGTDLAG